jgi:tetratricopeptide (TPR) repeat protein
MSAALIQNFPHSKMSLHRWKNILGIFSFCFLTHCSSGPPPSPLPPSASDLNLLGQAYLCQTETEANASWLKPGSQKTPWGGGSEIFQEIVRPLKQGQWVVFNEDQTLVGVITVFPDGLSLDDYPTLRKTLSQLPPTRDFYLTSSQLLEGQVPDSATLYRTGKATTTHQYYLRHRPGQDDDLIMAVFVLDPYESLLDGSHHKFLSYLQISSSPSDTKTILSTTPTSANKDFLGLQQFARGEIALFGSCGTKHPDIAQDAYQKAIHYGLSETKQLAEAHHRLGLSFSQLEKFPEAKASIEKALMIQPHASNILNSYGTALVKLEKIPAGIQAYEQALALQPAYAQARFNLARAFESINQKRAIQEYETFVVLAEDNPELTARVAIAKAKIETLQNQ